MRVAIKLFRVDAILDEDKSYLCDVEIGFLLEFSAQRRFGGFTPLSFTAGNTPEIRPFVSANHQDLFGFVEDQSTDGDDGPRRRVGVVLRWT